MGYFGSLFICRNNHIRYYCQYSGYQGTVKVGHGGLAAQYIKSPPYISE